MILIWNMKINYVVNRFPGCLPTFEVEVSAGNPRNLSGPARAFRLGVWGKPYQVQQFARVARASKHMNLPERKQYLKGLAASYSQWVSSK